MPGRAALLVSACVGALATACSGGDGASTPVPTTTSPPATDPAPSSTTTTVVPVVTIPSTGAATAPAGDEVTLHASGVHLADAGDAFRVVVHSDAAQVTVTVRSAARLRVCPVSGLDGPASGQGCVTPGSGVATRLPLAPAYTGVEVARTGGSQAVTVDEVAVSYRPRDPAMEIRLPTMVAGVPPAGTVFEVTPYGTGSFRAQARWTGPAGQQPGDGELVIESGPPTNRRLVAKATGAPGGTVSGTQTTPTEMTLTMRATGGAPLQAPTLTVTWPS